MTAETKIEVVGLKDSLRVLQEYNKSLRRQITKDYKYIVNDVVQELQMEVPVDVPISGFARRWTTKSGFQMLPWKGGLAQKSVKPYVSGKKPKEFNGVTRNLAVFGIKWQNARATLFDLSADYKTPQGRNMVHGLTSKFGKPSRAMWPTFTRYEADITSKMRDLVDHVTKAANEELRKVRGK